MLSSVVGIVIFASFVRLWPYKMEFTLKHYGFGLPSGMEPLWNSLTVSIASAIAGMVMTTLAAIVAQKYKTFLNGPLSFLSILPSAIPGMVLGLGYIFAFNAAGNPLNALYGTLSLIVILTVYYNHAHGFLIVSTSLNQISQTFDEAAATLGAGPLRTAITVTLPGIAPAIVSVATLYFMRSMVSLSAVIFLIRPSTQVASVSVMQLTDRGAYNEAAAFSVCIMAIVLTALSSANLLLRLMGKSDIRIIR